MRSPLDRATLRRRALLVADRALGELEAAYVSVRGGAARRREAANTDSTGRSTVESVRHTNVGATTWPLFADAAARGADTDALVAALGEATERAGETLAQDLRRRSPQMLREHRRINRGMNRRMRAIWGPALDVLYGIYVSIEELGDAHVRAGPKDAVTTAVGALHGRACLLLLEVHSLLANGLPNGAWGRTRSLHENAVVTALLSLDGREAGFEDLAQRFLGHAAVDELRDLKTARHAGAAIADADIIEAETRVRSLVELYGEGYDRDYGWARPLAPNTPPHRAVSFARLEQLAATELGRYEYRQGNHHVHASARSMDLHVLERGGRSYRLTGPTNVGLTGPASVAVLAALTSTRALVFARPGPVEPMDLVTLSALSSLANEAIELFNQAQELVDVREERLQRRLKKGSPS